MPKKLKKLQIDRVDFVDAGANEFAHITLFKRDITHDQEPPMAAPTVEQLRADLEAIQAKLEEATATVDQLTKDNEALTKRLEGAPEPKKPEVTLDPVVKAEMEALRKDNAALKEDVSKMQAERRRVEFIAKAGEFEVLAKADDFGPILATVQTHLEEGEYTSLLEALRKGAHAVRTLATYRPIGADDGPANSAESRFNAAAQEIAKRDGITFEAGVEKAISERRDLYDAYVREEGMS